ncbi:MAG: beta-galactosidase, partial [Lachnospiraceae bacterium]|nr:beta-galactosidase [Lachnospiraceae bacterium]
MTSILDLTNVRKQPLYELPREHFFGTSPEGTQIGFNNYYMLRNGRPFFAISGECHFSRVPENQWEDTVIKMKAGGLNVVATYVFWNHHEEKEGHFRFDGRRNLRKFVEICGKYGMYVILRMGPFDHGEVRNGGLPDWLYGKPFDVRSDNEGFLACTRKLYHQIALQIQGLLFQEGGPVIAAQLDNEYMHSGAPWEMTTGISDEWVPAGRDGDRYMKKLRTMAEEEGIRPPFYTCTGWGGAATPADEMLPLWGGYAFWPWMFYHRDYVHPATPEYLYRDNHNAAVPETYNFTPTYDPETRPYACCEMGGGMMSTYAYRFRFPYESVDAMANIKMGSGCNFLGYYMYRGGNNPASECGIYLNESQCPKISYDYQAPIGEFGQLRPSYFRLRAVHLFAKHFADTLCDLVTVLPEGSGEIDPADQKPLRYCVRSDGQRGYLFINNYQDHAVCKDKMDRYITLKLSGESLTVGPISLDAEENAILPFQLDMEGTLLKYATAQPLSVLREGDQVTYIFFTPKGMESRFVFEDGIITASNDGQRTSFYKKCR